MRGKAQCNGRPVLFFTVCEPKYTGWAKKVSPYCHFGIRRSCC